MNLYQQTYQALMQTDTHIKREQISALLASWKNDELNRETSELIKIEIPGRPTTPELIHPNEIKQRKLGSELGRATLIHAILHIEFNAINLALDAVYRFRDMPEQYYSDWLLVASEEAYHFSLLEKRLNEMGYVYGDMPAHNGLWEMVLKTDHDVLIRMALVPRVLEARGLDVTPGMIEKLTKVGDDKTVEILNIILRDEIGHVAIGSHWFKYCCELKNIEPEQTFRDLLIEYMGRGPNGPLHQEARLQAGFSQDEIDALINMV
ncbi:MAG: uncharacterized ferritin-like protein (DUF455 family) [Cocleimonas sp.]|jgi:uncharacterized ferritin-like protein (DUF455 family)